MSFTLDFNPKDFAWVRMVHNRIRSNKNFMGIFTGPTGSGKSWAAISYATMLDPTYNTDRVIFTQREFMKLLDKGLPRGAVIIWDEAGLEVSNRNWQSEVNKTINYVLQSFRYLNLIILFTAPYADFVDAATRKLIHAEFIVTSINKNNNETTIVPRWWQYNPYRHEIFPHVLEETVYNKETEDYDVTEYDIMFLPKAPQFLLDEYELKRANYMKEYRKSITDYVNDDTEGPVVVATPRQKEYLELHALGKTDANIAVEMGCSVANISILRKALKKKGLLV